MSKELENQIEEDLFKDKATHFFKKYRKLLILLLILFITVPSFYQIYKSYNLKKNSNLLTDYSKAMLILNGNEPNNAIHLFEKLIKNHDNEKYFFFLNTIVDWEILKNFNSLTINKILVGDELVFKIGDNEMYKGTYYIIGLGDIKDKKVTVEIKMDDETINLELYKKDLRGIWFREGIYNLH